MATKYKKDKSVVGTLIGVVILTLFAGVVITLTAGATRQTQTLNSKAAISPIQVTFEAANANNGITMIDVFATSSIGLGFAEVNLIFDPTKIQLAQEVIGGSVLPLVTRAAQNATSTTEYLSALPTTMAEANVSGQIQVPLALPTSNTANPPTGKIMLFRVPFKFVTGFQGSSPLSVDTNKTNFIDMGGNTVAFDSTILTLSTPISNTPTSPPSSTLQPTVQPTIRPSATPTRPTTIPTVRPSATPTARPTTIPTVRPSATPTARPTVIPTVRPSATPTTRPTVIPTVRPSATPTMYIKPSQAYVSPTVRPTPKVSPEPTGTTPNFPEWIENVPPRFREFLKQWYLWRFFFRRDRNN